MTEWAKGAFATESREWMGGTSDYVRPVDALPKAQRNNTLLAAQTHTQHAATLVLNRPPRTLRTLSGLAESRRSLGMGMKPA